MDSCFKVAFQYANDIISGRKIANKYRIKACQRFIDDLNSMMWDYVSDDAEFVCHIIEKTICHQQGEDLKGNPLRGEPFILMDYHKFIIANLLGFKEKGTNINRFKEALDFVPRKNVKTSFAAAFAYAYGLRYRKSGTKMYVVAAAQKQTMETFNFLKYNIKNMGEHDIDGGLFHIIDNNNEHSITAEIGDGFFNLNALASNPDAQDSFNCNFAIADEIHAFKKPKQYNLFKEAMKSYRNKLMFGISTAGDDPTGFLANRVRHAKRILDKEIIDDSYFIFICEADYSIDEEGNRFLDYTNPVIHEMANPGYNQSVMADDLMNDALQAQNDPQQRKDFFAKSLNVFTSAMNTYFDIVKVETSDNKYDWTLEDLAKLPIKWYGGADLSKMNDLTGAALYGTYKDVDICISHAFIPISIAYRKADEDSIPVFWWEEEGWLTMCNSSVIDYEYIVKWFIEMRKKGFKIAVVGYDRRYSREYVLKMKKAGFKMIDQQQRYVEKTEAFREIEKKILLNKFYYVHNQAFLYCITNVKAIEDSDEFVRFEKVLPHCRIDLFDAGVIACKQKLKFTERSSNASVYID